MFEIFQYEFMIRSLEAGVIISLLAPLIGIFLVLRRYSLIADTLSHVSLAGIATGLFLNIHPIIAALGVTAVASLGIERLRSSQRIYGESALALFLFGSLAVAVILFRLSGTYDTSLYQYLFGSVTTVTANDVMLVLVVGCLVAMAVVGFYKELVYMAFDEDAAKVSGVPTKKLNTMLVLLSAITVSLCIPIVGVLLIAALLVIPVVSALLLRRSFFQTLVAAEVISLCCVIFGITASYYFDIAAGPAIVVMLLGVFLSIFIVKQ